MKKLFVLFLTLGTLSSIPVLAQGDYDKVFFDKGKALLEEKKFFDASKEFDNALAINPTANYYYYKGLALRLAKKYSDAAEAYESSILLDKEKLQSYKDLVMCYGLLRDDKQLIETWNGISKNIPNVQEKLEAKFNIVNFLMKQRDYDTALIHAEDAVNISPNDVNALHLYAKVNNTIERYEEAKTSAGKAASLLNTSDIKVVSKVYYELGYACHYLGDFDTKLTSFEKVREPSYRPLMARLTPEYFTSLASSFDQIFEYKEAEIQLEKALRVDNHNPEANKLQAVISGHEHPKHEMIAFYKKGITGVLKKKETDDTNEYDQELLEDYERLIELKINSKEFERAITTAEECLTIFAQQPLATEDIEFLRAIAMYKENRAQEAINLLISMSQPNDPSNRARTPVAVSKYNFAVGNMYFKQKEYDKAKSFFSRARKAPFANAAQYMFEKILDLENPRNVTATNE